MTMDTLAPVRSGAVARLVAATFAAALLSDTCIAQILDCVPAAPLRVTVRIDDGTNNPAPRSLLLIGDASPSLRLMDPDTGRTAWSASAAGPTAQQYPAMTAAFSTSLTALDTDADGLHDRLYAGDLSGRLWRFDLHNGARVDHWTTGGVFANLADPVAGRAFVAAPDVSLSAPAAGRPWLSIALGSASLSSRAANNRFYVLRDYAIAEQWSQAQYTRWRPLRETDLTLSDGTQLDNESAATDDQRGSGYYINLGSGQVLAPSITVAGRAVLAVAEAYPSFANHCAVPVSVSAFGIDTGHSLFDVNNDGVMNRSDWRVTLPAVMPATTAFALTVNNDGRTTATCVLGDASIPACRVDTSLSKSYWRREDAD
jgi:hypothetical protein